MIKRNGSITHISKEEIAYTRHKRSERMNDKLSHEVGAACDRFFEQRKLRRNFSDLWRLFTALKAKQ
jgi:hypothetical protein